MADGLYVPGSDGKFQYKGVKENEERPILTYEEGSGVILLNFNLILAPRGRKLQDVVIQTADGYIMGLVLTSTEMGPEEKKQRGLK